jgi:asparagine synthase (glutamine-hydrolysing)
VGDFAFAIWDEAKRKLFCAVDHTGTRTLYYYRGAGFFAFCTVLKPFFVLPEIKREYDETWIADFLAIPSVMHQLDPELTPYRDIFLLPAGHTLTVRSDGAVKDVYWRAAAGSEIRLKSDEEYEAAFREVLGEAVRCRLRSLKPVAVMMSGGLDSTSVASLAARELAGKPLPVFTAVPMHGYRNWVRTGTLADESPHVEAVKEHAGNIDVIYCRSEGKHPLSDTGRLLAMLEQPYKIFQNLFWLDSIMAAARERNMGVVLTGGSGNNTISWGYLQPCLLYLLRVGRLRRLFREIWTAVRGRPHPVRALYRVLMPLLPYGVQKNMQRVMYHDRLREIEDLLPVNPEFAGRMCVRRRFRRFHYDSLFINHMDSYEMRQKLLAPDIFSHYGVITSKHGLAYGLAQRDPTMDKRVIEFCLRVPESQYFRDGNDRFLLRRAMSGLLPDKVRLNTAYGLQSADWFQRLQPFWPEVDAEIRGIGTLENEKRFLNVPKILEEVNRIDISNDELARNSNLRMLIRSVIFSRFLRYEGEVAGDDCASFC